MKINEERILASAIDLKNLFLLGEGYREKLEFEMKFDPMLNKGDVKLYASEVVVNLYTFGFLCLPLRGTTFSNQGLNCQLSNFDNLIKSVKHYFGGNEEYELFKRASKFYLNTYIKCLDDKTGNQHMELTKNNLNESQTRKYLGLYTKTLHRCEVEGGCIFHVCDDLEYFILSHRN